MQSFKAGLANPLLGATERVGRTFLVSMPSAKSAHTQDPGCRLVVHRSRFSPTYTRRGGPLELGDSGLSYHFPTPYIPPCLWPGPGVCGGGQFQFPLGAGWSWPLLGWGSHCGGKVCLRLWLGPLSSSAAV